MIVTRETICAAYVFLRQTPPFNRWRLPEPGEVRFTVLRKAQHYGDHEFLNGRHHIRVSIFKHRHLLTLLKTVAHEMIHMHETRTNRNGSSGHGKGFYRRAAQVCKHHGWDVGDL